MNSLPHAYIPPLGPRILIANENTVEAINMESWLHTNRLERVRLTTDAREVEPLYGKWPFGLLILDMHTALVDTQNLIRSLSAPINTGELSIVAVINPGDEQARLTALSAGAADTLVRPLNHATVTSCVYDILEARPLTIVDQHRANTEG